MKQNITLSLDKDLLRKAKILAAQRQVSVSRMLADELKRIVDDVQGYELANSKCLENLRKGFHLGGDIVVSREELHER